MDDGITYIVSAQGAGRGPFGPEGVFVLWNLKVDQIYAAL